MRRRGVLREVRELPEDLAGTVDPAALVGDRELFDEALAAVEALPEPYREVLLLRLVHGLTPAAIAHTLGRAPGTVRMQLQRGTERLRRALPDRRELVDVADSRCPDGVNCVWAGDVTASIRLVDGGRKAVTFKITNGGRSTGEKRLGAHTYLLVGVAPYPVFGRDIPVEDYVATISID